MKRLVFLCIFLATGAANAQVDSFDVYASERERFAEAYAAQRNGRKQEAARLIKGLEDYPLYAYFRHFELERKLHSARTSEVREFLAAYDGSLLAARLRTRWLKELARGRRWQEFIEDYRPQSNIELQCHHLRARIEMGAVEGVATETRALWLTGKSRPQVCDPAFKYLSDNDFIDDALRWQRIHLALEQNQLGLARYLARSFSDARQQTTAERWFTAHTHPSKGLASAARSDTQDNRSIAIHALKRLAKKNLAQADAGWSKIRTELAFKPLEQATVARILAIAAAQQDHPQRIAYLDRVPREALTERVEKYRIREGIRAQAWPQLTRWLALPPVGDISELRWRYWRARALAASGKAAQAKLLFQDLAQERDYYGFLSADQIGVEYSMNNRPINASEAELATLSANPGIRRAKELFRLNMKFKARREWLHEVSKMDKRELEVAAQLVNRWGWYDRAILALGRAKSYDDLEVRFPLLYSDLVEQYATKRKLAAALIYSIIRTESAFMDDARSVAGALGLMQLMPATGRETARQIGAPLANAKGLLVPSKNIMIGSAYLKKVLDRFKGSFSMAAAAYNAGPHRVKSWLPQSGCVPADIWIDTIPFTETRRYVRRASFYAVIYQWRLHQAIAPISELLDDVNANGKTEQC